jgi:hypothetical protein
MGFGNYSHAAHEALLRDRASIPTQDVFAQRSCHPLMNPNGVRVREARDSADHPNSIGIVFALDVTGSMADIPEMLARKHLPVFMKLLVDVHVKDPQLLFMAVGDATSDRAPLQVGQFESTAQLMDQWLTRSFLERGGGAGGQESYELALYFLAQHTEMDCMVKRNKRGYLIMTGDEEPYPILARTIVNSVVGDRLDEDLKVEEVVALLQETFVPFFLIPDQKRRARCERTWRNLLGDHVICMDDAADTCWAAAGAIVLHQRIVPDVKALSETLGLAGAPPDRITSVAHALKPLAASLK